MKLALMMSLFVNDPCDELAKFAYEVSYNHQLRTKASQTFIDDVDQDDTAKLRIIIDIVREAPTGDLNKSVEIGNNVYAICYYDLYNRFPEEVNQ